MDNTTFQRIIRIQGSSILLNFVPEYIFYNQLLATNSDKFQVYIPGFPILFDNLEMPRLDLTKSQQLFGNETSNSSGVKFTTK